MKLMRNRCYNNQDITPALVFDLPLDSQQGNIEKISGRKVSGGEFNPGSQRWSFKSEARSYNGIITGLNMGFVPGEPIGNITLFTQGNIQSVVFNTIYFFGVGKVASSANPAVGLTAVTDNPEHIWYTPLRTPFWAALTIDHEGSALYYRMDRVVERRQFTARWDDYSNQVMMQYTGYANGTGKIELWNMKVFKGVLSHDQLRALVI